MNFSDKVVVITGAGGSIGSEICKQLVFQGVKELRLVSLTESALYRVTNTLKELMASATAHWAGGRHAKVVGILGSVLDYKLMLEVTRHADLVIHAAAHKHVPICEANPLAAIENNTIGTACLADAARVNRVNDFVFVSTDKAVKPSSVMGMSKRFAELILRDHAVSYFQGGPIQFRGVSTQFRIVRFGNVLDSDGSVLPLWRKQIAAGGPVTLTDKRCTRYFMSIPEAAELVLGVLDLEPVIGPFVFDMGEPKNMCDMAQALINQEHAMLRVRIVETGLRPGEKLTEELTYGGEAYPTAHPKIKVIEEPRVRLTANTLIALTDAVQGRRARDALDILWSVA